MWQKVFLAMDIVAESISDEADYRIRIREMTMKKGMLVSVAKKPEETTVYEMYYDHEEPVSKVAGHRVLAINRGTGGNNGLRDVL